MNGSSNPLPGSIVKSLKLVIKRRSWHFDFGITVNFILGFKINFMDLLNFFFLLDNCRSICRGNKKDSHVPWPSLSNGNISQNYRTIPWSGYGHGEYQDTERFHPHVDPLYYCSFIVFTYLPTHPVRPSWQSSHLFSISKLFEDWCINGMTQYINFGVWLHPPSPYPLITILWRFIQTIAWNHSLLFLWLGIRLYQSV